ncbi:MAG: imidazole glycerol phosphate synthase subunit HisH [Bacteroidales bacterium]|nr:imidazole glycerol phosphate synthase subunit HisH [Bacteroidales bacterium]
MIAIIDYEAGNICSVQNALERLGAPYELTADPERIRKADKVILPGVGNAAQAMASLRASGLDKVIRSLRQPVLGICVGLQLLCRSSEEGPVECMGIFDSRVRRFPKPPAGDNSCSAKKRADATQLLSDRDDFFFAKKKADAPQKSSLSNYEAKVPHMGWNSIGNLESKLFKDLPGGSYVYFVHSYYPELCPDTIATCRHGDVLFSAALRWENFYGTQFHPEKSGSVGAAILQNFLAL